MKAKRKPFRIDSDFFFLAAVYAIIFVVVITTLYPLVFVVSASISDPIMVNTGKMLLWPVGFTLEGYEYLMAYKDVWVGYANTIFYTITGTLLNLFATLTAAYSLSRKDLKYKGFIMGLFIFTMYFGGGLIPAYMNVKSLHLLNTRAVMMILGLVSTYNMIVARTYFANSIPWELQESAMIDGASAFKIFWSIVIPLSKPITAVLSLYYAVGHWNSYFTGMIYLRDRTKWTLQQFLREILIQGQILATSLSDEVLEPEVIIALQQQQDMMNLLKYCVIIVAMMPLLIIYPFVQKFFAKGLMIGSVKG